MTLVPNPSRAGGPANITPFSRQANSIWLSLIERHRTETSPFAEDHAPYFTALVASSYKIRANGVVVSLVSETDGPSISRRDGSGAIAPTTASTSARRSEPFVMPI